MSDTSLEFRAVQESATSFCMDWPVFESRESREIRSMEPSSCWTRKA
jgi:hypothetical protein